MPRRTKNVRSWPLFVAAAICWGVWLYSMHAPATWRPTERQYVSLQRGCVAYWCWSPGERSPLGFRDNLSITAYRTQPVAFQLPFAWRDGWGYGIGCPLWLPAAVFAALALRRYLRRAGRQSPLALRNRRLAALLASVAIASLTAWAISFAHRTEPLLGPLTLENGALAFTRDNSPPPPPGYALPPTINLALAAPTPAPRQSPFVFDLLPDFFSAATGWRLSLPLWPVVLLTGWWAFRAIWSARFQGPGLCLGCGYDRSGLGPELVCPECGTPGEGGTPTPTT